MQKLLILGGTTEATFLATSLAGDTRFATILSFAGATRTPRPPPVAWRVGGYGGAEGLAAFLRGEGIDLLIDATHPFAARMKRNAVAAARHLGLEVVMVDRPPPPDTETVADAEASLRWLDHEAARRGV